MNYISNPVFPSLITAPNGLRYLQVGGARQRYFDGTSFEPRKVPEKRGDSYLSDSIMKGGHGRSMSDRSSRDRRAARSPCPCLLSPNS